MDLRPLIPMVAMLCVFGMPVAIVFVNRYFKFKERELERGLGAHREEKLLGSGGADGKESKERKLLEARLQNLETIVCSVDFELNQRLNRVAAEASAAGRWLPPAATSAAAAVLKGQTAELVSAEAAAADRLVKEGGARAVEVRPSYVLGHLEPGAVVLDRYTIVREIGRGGMGAVYLADDSKLSERVALKVFATISAADPELAAERFRREAQAARRITHPNVVRIHDLHEDGRLLFLTMELIEGDTLAAFLRKRDPLPVSEALAVLGEVALGVSAAHAAGVIHRDIKPQNVIVGASPAASGAGSRVVKVIDFGLASTTFLAGMTATGMILGTAEYMAPEQVRGTVCDARADVYALGALAYHVFCGHPPFRGDTPIAVGFAQLTEPPRPPRELRPEIPEGVERAILRALAKDPAARFADAAAFRKALIG
jgi:tRNA A-37 threonylcarbamoyl transferase component Bud32